MQCGYGGCCAEAFKPVGEYSFCIKHRCKRCAHKYKPGLDMKLYQIKKGHVISSYLHAFCGLLKDKNRENLCSVADCEYDKVVKKYCYPHYVESCSSCHSKILGKKASRCYNCYNNDLYYCGGCMKTYNKKFMIRNIICYRCAYDIPALNHRQIKLRVTPEIIYIDEYTNFDFMYYLYSLYSTREDTWELFKLPRDIFDYIMSLTILPPYLITLDNYIRSNILTKISFF